MVRYIEVNEWPHTTEQYIYVKSAKPSSRNEQWVGCVLGGCFLKPKISDEDLLSRPECLSKHYDPRVGIFLFWHRGWETFHLDDIVIISTPGEAENGCPKWGKFHWEHWVGELRDPEYKLAPDNVVRTVDHIVKYMKNEEFKEFAIGKVENWCFIERVKKKNSQEEYETITKELYEACKKDSRFTREKFNKEESVFKMDLK